MDTLKLNSKQIQVAIDQLTTQPEGLNKLMEMALNSLMKAGRVRSLKQSHKVQPTTLLAV